MQRAEIQSEIILRGDLVNRLSALQLAALMLCARCFSMMTYFPYTGSNTLVFMVAILLSTALQWLLLLPVSVICSRYEKGVCEIAIQKNRIFGLVITSAFLLYFAWDIFITTGTFAYFMDTYFSNQISRIPAVICAGGVAVYLGGLGSSVLGKSAGIMFLLFCIFTGILVLSAADRPDLTNFHLAQENIPKTLFDDINAELVRNRELVLLVFLLGDVKGSKRKSVFSYLAVKLVILEVMIGFVTLVLGSFGSSTDMPFFYLSCYSNSSVVERYDAGFMSVWTALAVVRLAAVLHCFSRCLRLIFKGISAKTAAAVQIIPAAVTFYLLSKRSWKGLAYLRESPWLIALLTGAVPLAVLLVMKVRKRANEI